MSKEKPFMLVVDGSIEITRGKNPKVTLLFDILCYDGKRLSPTVLSGIDNATLTHRCMVADRFHGAGHRYHLAVIGDAVRCAAIQNVIISMIKGDRAKVTAFRKIAQGEPA